MARYCTKDSLAPRCRRERVRKLKDRAAELTGGQMTAWVAPDCPPELEEQFWRNVVEFEQAEDTVLFDLLMASGVLLPRPDELADRPLTEELWEVIRALAALGVYLHSTDHRSDRALYAYLWNEGLREPTTIIPNNPDFTWHLDLVGSGSEEDIFLYLKYYADEDTRRSWAAEWSDMAIPDHQAPPFDRDRHLPQPSGQRT